MWSKLIYIPTRKGREIMTGRGVLNNNLPSHYHTNCNRSQMPSARKRPISTSSEKYRSIKARKEHKLRTQRNGCSVQIPPRAAPGEPQYQSLGIKPIKTR